MKHLRIALLSALFLPFGCAYHSPAAKVTISVSIIPPTTTIPAL